MLAGKAGSLPKSGALEMLFRDKHSSLFRTFYVTENIFVNTAPGAYPKNRSKLIYSFLNLDRFILTKIMLSFIKWSSLQKKSE